MARERNKNQVNRQVKWFSNYNDCYEEDKQGVVMEGFLEEVMLKMDRSQAGKEKWGKAPGQRDQHA